MSKISFVSLFSLSETLRLIPSVPHLRSLIVENNGFEPLTLCVQGRCSSQLS